MMNPMSAVDAKPTYLSVGRAPDLVMRNERLRYRFFEMLPGLLAWSTLFGTVIFSAILPLWVAMFIILFDVYWLLKTIFLSLHLVAAYRKMKENLAVDWLNRLELLDSANSSTSWKDIRHLVIVPFYNEPLEVIQLSLSAIAASHYPLDRFIVVLASEERSGEHGKRVCAAVQSAFEKTFFRFIVTVHPAGIVGEIAGKGSNEAWAGKRAKEYIDTLGIAYERVVVSVLDSDTRVPPGYFARLTHAYLTAAQPLHTSFQPIPVFSNNFWDAPFFSRVVASSATFWHMMKQEQEERLTTFSSHSMSFWAIVRMGFWQPNVVSEDSRVFWQALFVFDGNYRVAPLHYPVSMDACIASTALQTVKNQYKQQRRWGWGVENIPYMLLGFIKNKNIPLRKKLYYTGIQLEAFWSWSTNALMLFMLGWLPLWLGGEQFNRSVLSYNLPLITRTLMTLALIGMFVSAAISMLLLPPRPARYRKGKTLLMALQWLILPFSILLLGALPGLEAQTRLMFGKYLGFWVTEKARKTL